MKHIVSASILGILSVFLRGTTYAQTKIRLLYVPMRPMHRMALAAAGVSLLTVLALMPRIAAAENIKIGMIKTAGGGSFFIAQDKGYFAAEGLTVEFVFFDAAPPIAVAAVSGDVDFGSVSGSAALFTLGGQGALKIIGGSSHEQPTFRVFAAVVANRAYDAGLRSLKDLSGHSVAITQVGGGLHYSLTLVEEKYNIDEKSIRLLALQSNANVVSAVTGGQADVGFANATAVTPSVNRGDLKLLSYIGDITPFQTALLFTATKVANGKGDLVKKTIRALNKGERDYHNAFTAVDGSRKDQATAPETLAIISKYVGLPPDQVGNAIAYVDPEGRLDVKDVLHQIAWFKSQGMVKSDFDPKSVMDMRYVVPLPDK